jgi:hypothetical protein
MKLAACPLTPDLWPALEDLFGENGACNGCWCMYGRIGSAYRKRPREQNKAAFREIVERGPPPGLLAFNGDVAVGWCQLTPRDAVPWLDRTWRLRRVDDVPVWSLSCFYARKGSCSVRLSQREVLVSRPPAARMLGRVQARPAPAVGGLGPESGRARAARDIRSGTGRSRGGRSSEQDRGIVALTMARPM